MKNLDISCISLAAILLLVAAAGGNVNTMRYSRILPAHYRTISSSGGNHRRYYPAFQRSYIVHRGPAAKTQGGVPKSSQFTSYGDGPVGARRAPSRTFAYASSQLIQPTPRSRNTNRHRSLKSSLVTTLRRYEKTGNKTELIRRVEKILTNLHVHQKSVSYARRMINTHRQKNQAEFGRLWSGLHETKRGVAGLQLQCGEIARNLTAVHNNLQHTDQLHNNNLLNVHQKLRQIEEHQDVQDRRYFEVVEKGLNASRDLSQIKEEIDQELRSMRLERDSVTQSISHVQRRLQTIFNEELNQHRSVLSQIERTIATHNDMLLNHDGTIAFRQSKITTINETMQNQKREIADLNIRIQSLQQNAHDSNINIYRLLKQARSRLSTIADLQSSVVRLNRSMLQTNFKETYLEAKVANLEEALQRIIDHLNKVESVRVVGNAPDVNSSAANAGNGTEPPESQHMLKDDKLLVELQSIKLKPIVLNQPKHTSTTVRDVMDAIEETGFEDRLDRMSRSLKHHNDKLTNVTDTMKSVMEDVRSLSMTTSNYFSIINEQAKTIRKQNETITSFLHKFSYRDGVLASHLEYQHETMLKLMNIITSFARQFRKPLQQHRDCHDMWMDSQMTSGVYTLVKNMDVMPVYCNMTDKGGWTIIQRRMDGTQDFDTNLQDYERGFGSVFGEHWLGLENIRWLTHGRIYSLRIILEDWGGNFRYATYDQFMVYGSNYVLMVSGYNGDAGDAMMVSNDVPFQARRQSRDISITRSSDCPSTRQSGWWFPNDCGDANLNGPYPRDPQQAKAERETNNLSQFANPATRWMKWRSDDFPPKKISMQIIPHEALIETVFSTNETSEDSSDTDYSIESEPNQAKATPSEEVDEEPPVYSVRHINHHQSET